MFALIRRALDAKRLASELERAELRIAQLEHQASQRPHLPSFVEVAKEFDVSQLHDEVRAKVVDDLAPMLERSALDFLKTAMREMPKETRRPIIGLAAYDRVSRTHHFRFESPAMGTTVISHI